MIFDGFDLKEDTLYICLDDFNLKEDTMYIRLDDMCWF